MIDNRLLIKRKCLSNMASPAIVRYASLMPIKRKIVNSTVDVYNHLSSTVNTPLNDMFEPYTEYGFNYDILEPNTEYNHNLFKLIIPSLGINTNVSILDVEAHKNSNIYNKPIIPTFIRLDAIITRDETLSKFIEFRPIGE